MDWIRPESSLPSITFPLHRMLLDPRKSAIRSLPKPTSLVANHADGAPPMMRGTLTATFVIPDARAEVPINLLESHLVELGFVLLERSFHPRTN